MFDVTLKAYEGPLELLLDLIKENKVDIYDIPIAEITTQYLQRIEEMKELNLGVAGEFLVMAASLIYIKSKMLLPEDEVEIEEEVIDPRNELVQKLLEYQSFKEAAKDLDQLQAERGKIYRRHLTDYHINVNPTSSHFLETMDGSLYRLIEAFSSVLTKNSLESFHEIYEEIIPIEIKIDYLKSVLSEKGAISFDSLFEGRKSRNELIATFLALLELIKQKFAKVVQENHFDSIEIQKMQ